MRILLLVSGSGHLELEDLRAFGVSGSRADLHTTLWKLQSLSLLEWSGLGWRASWLGAGVANWHYQRLYCMGEQFLPGPRCGENGRDLSRECTEYRPLFCRPGFCWCGRLQMDHALELSNLVELWLQAELTRRSE